MTRLGPALEGPHPAGAGAPAGIAEAGRYLELRDWASPGEGLSEQLRGFEVYDSSQKPVGAMLHRGRNRQAPAGFSRGSLCQGDLSVLKVRAEQRRARSSPSGKGRRCRPCGKNENTVRLTPPQLLGGRHVHTPGGETGPLLASPGPEVRPFYHFKLTQRS